jgi:hypothetical protein
VQQPDPAPLELGVVEAEDGERLAQVVEGLAGRDDPDPVVGPGADDPVEAVERGVAQGDVGADAVAAALQLGQRGLEELRGRLVGERAAADQQLGQHRLDPVGVHLRGPGAVGDVGHDLERGPQPGCPRHRDGVLAEVEHVLRVGRVERGDPQVGQQELGRPRHGRRLRGRVVADERHRPAGRVGARHVGVPQRVGGPVQPGRLPVPEPGDPVDAPVRGAADVLGALHGGGRQLLVDRGPEDDVVRVQQLPAPPQLQVVAAQWGALVAGDEQRRAPPGPPVGPADVEREPGERVHAGQVDGAVLEPVAVVQDGTAGLVGHWAPPRSVLPPDPPPRSPPLSRSEIPEAPPVVAPEVGRNHEGEAER